MTNQQVRIGLIGVGGICAGVHYPGLSRIWEFVSAIRARREATPSFYHGMRAQAMADTILQAAAERRWVDVPVSAI